jgi:hypothetical protein
MGGRTKCTSAELKSDLEGEYVLVAGRCAYSKRFSLRLGPTSRIMPVFARPSRDCVFEMRELAAATTVINPRTKSGFVLSITGKVSDSRAYEVLIDIGPNSKVDVLFSGKSPKAVAVVALTEGSITSGVSVAVYVIFG